MRNVSKNMFCAAIIASAFCSAPAFAHYTDNTANSSGHAVPVTATDPVMERSATGDSYIVNPLELTNTRDNRGNISCAWSERAWHYDASTRDDNWDGSPRSRNAPR